MNTANGRKSYLLDGRRVRLSDLIDAGMLEPDQQLRFVRARSGETHTAVVDRAGHLVVAGRSYATPSAAARVTAGTGQFDGWTAWSTESGESLHTMRLRLLDSLAEDAGTASGPYDGRSGFQSALPRHEYLKTAAEAARRDDPQKIKVRDLLRFWDALARGSQVRSSISADLANHGLTTEPDFLSVTLDDEVMLIEEESDPASITGVDAGSGETATEVAHSDAITRHEIGLTLGNVVNLWRPLEWVKPTATIEEAITKMLVNEYSQLPVMKGEHNLVGAVTWRSIAQARLKDPHAPLSAAIVKATQLVYSDDLHEVLPTLQAEDFIVVANPQNRITGIVTTADVVALYHDRTLPFLLIGELDQELRRLIEDSIPLDTVRSVCASSDRPDLESFDEMEMGHYQRVLENQECWSLLSWPLDRVTVIKRIEELRKIRNDVAHFNPDPLPPGTVEKLRTMLAVIRGFRRWA